MTSPLWAEITKDAVFQAPGEEDMDHVASCCAYHGCLFGDFEDCPVATLKVSQKSDCEDCLIGNEVKRPASTASARKQYASLIRED